MCYKFLDPFFRHTSSSCYLTKTNLMFEQSSQKHVKGNIFTILKRNLKNILKVVQVLSAVESLVLQILQSFISNNIIIATKMKTKWQC